MVYWGEDWSVLLFGMVKKTAWNDKKNGVERTGKRRHFFNFQSHVMVVFGRVSVNR
jgi:hypothetical protein